MSVGIYAWTNKFNNKVYIGKSKNLELRKSQFLSKRIRIYGGKYINRARLKYQNIKNAWSYEVLTYCTKEALDELEKFFINNYKKCGYTLYNLTQGGEGITGFKFTPEQVLKMRAQCRQGSIHNKKVIQKDLNGNTINIFISTREAGEKVGLFHVTISNACRGKNYTLGHQSNGFYWEYMIEI